MSIQPGKIFGLLLYGIFGIVQQAEAESEFGTSVNGSLRGAYFTSSRDLDDVDSIGGTALWIKAKSALSSNASLTAEGWAQYEGARNSHKSQAKVREAYLDLSLGKLDVRLGKQIIAWGRADKLNPTDNLTPRDYTLQVIDDEEQRLGATAAMFHYPLQGNDLVLTGVWMPRINRNVVPISRPPGIVFSESVPNTNQFAIKLDRSGGGLDWSLSYLNGVNLNPELELSGVSSNGVAVLMRHKRVSVLGMDAATVVGRYGLRAEVAYTWIKADTNLSDLHTNKPFFYLVLGGDRTFDTGVNVNLQYFLYRVSGYVDPRGSVDPLSRSIGIENAIAAHQLDPRQHGVSFRVSKKWLNDTLEGEIAGILSLSASDFTLKPRLIYAMSDQIKVSAGLDLFRGDRNTFFGRLKDTSTAFVELRYSF